MDRVAQEPSAVGDDERELVREAQAGSRRAFDALVARHAGAVVRSAYVIVQSQEDAEDVAQETFLAAYRALPGYRPDAPFGAWLHRIAVNRGLDLVRRRARQHSLVDELKAEGASEEDQAMDQARAGEQREEVRALLATLDARNRAIVSLRFLQGMSIREIAAALEMPEGTIKRRLHEVLKLLRERMMEGAAR